MATQYSDKGGLRFSPRNRPEGALIAEPFSLTLNANAAAGEIYVLGRLPAGSTLVGFTIDFPALDTNAAPNTSVGIGDSGSAIRFMNTAIVNTAFRFSSWYASTAVGATDGADAQSLPRAYTSADDLRATITSAGVATAAGNTSAIKGTYFYTMTPFYSDPVF